MSTIFVQIASYRDPELLATIRDCIDKAKYPENLTFGICWQHSKEDLWDTLEEYKEDPRFSIIDVDYRKSKGLCWARSRIQKLYKGEDYTLQLDSHHRFLENWDEHLLSMIKDVPSEKPILTSYAGMYNPHSNEKLNIEPYKMVASRFTEGGTIMFYPREIEGWRDLKAPIPGRFVSGHFFFTIGKHCVEYAYDPNLYFAGDEISLSIRSYTLGYDIFHPHYTIIWHEYTREGRVKHWTDFTDENKQAGIVKATWTELDSLSKRRIRQLLKEEDSGINLGKYGLGKIRTHEDYERYAGINFERRKLHELTLEGKNPPIEDFSLWYEEEEKTYDLSLEIPKIENFKFIYVGIEDEFGNVIHREDLQKHIPVLKVTITGKRKPYKWVFWPVDNRGNWVNRADFLL